MSDEEGDPFEELAKDVEDREGDPFEHLTDAGDDTENTGGSDDSETDPLDQPAGDGPSSEQTGQQDQGTKEQTNESDDVFDQGLESSVGPESDQGAAGDAGPVEDQSGGDSSGMQFGVDRETERNSESTTDAFADIGQREGDPFEGANSAFEQMDVESVDPDSIWEGLESAEARGSVGEASKRTYAEVSKHSFCEQCEYFSKPPNVSCSHEGTEIVEFLDMEMVRLMDCPIVAERGELKKEE